VVLNDPPLADANGDEKFRPLDEILECDFITTHVPLTANGPYPTRHLVNGAFLDRMKPGSFYLNTARGAVADNSAVLAALNSGRLRGAVLDVWEGEPNVRLDVMDAVDIATPHIAGYSFDGKVKGTVQIYEAACAFLGIPADWSPAGLLPAPEHPHFTGEAHEKFLKKVVDTVYPIREDDTRMRAIAGKAPEERAAYFDMLRKTYPRRREFYNTRIGNGSADQTMLRLLQGIGFVVDEVDQVDGVD